MRILLVEDQPKLGAHLVRGLGEDGHVVEHVKDGVAAAAAGLRAGHDVIVLDWALPGRDGLDVLKEWRSRGLKTPVLMLTARDTLEERVQALRNGADDHLGKPFAYDELLARLEALHRRAAADPQPGAGRQMIDEQAQALRAQHGGQRLHAVAGDALGELGQHVADAPGDPVLVPRRIRRQLRCARTNFIGEQEFTAGNQNTNVLTSQGFRFTNALSYYNVPSDNLIVQQAKSAPAG